MWLEGRAVAAGKLGQRVDAADEAPLLAGRDLVDRQHEQIEAPVAPRRQDDRGDQRAGRGEPGGRGKTELGAQPAPATTPGHEPQARAVAIEGRLLETSGEEKGEEPHEGSALRIQLPEEPGGATSELRQRRIEDSPDLRPSSRHGCL